MKVLHILPRFIGGGPERHVLALAELWRKARYVAQHTLAVLEPPLSASLVLKARKMGVSILQEPMTSVKKVFFDQTEWRNSKGEPHREDGPAVEWADGYKEWYINGKRHREDGPAIETADGYKWWYIDGKRHREDGPAIEYANGNKGWWIDGKSITEEKFNRTYGFVKKLEMI